MGTQSKLTRLLRAMCLACVTLWPFVSLAQPVQESTIKAAFVYNFVLFTEWPQELLRTTDTINVCINAAGEMRESLQILNGKSAKGMRVKVVQIESFSKGLEQCHVLYIETQDNVQWNAMRKSLSGKRILTIADNLDVGGAMITLHIHENKVVFDIDQSGARTANLIFSSKLLRLARTVK